MTRFGKLGVVLAGVAVLLLGLTQLLYADQTVTGVVVEGGFTGLVLQPSDGAAAKYNTGKETVYTPSDYRPLRGDTVTITYYAKNSATVGEIQAVSTLTLVQKDANRKELTSPASGIIREVGRKSIRFEFPEVGQTVSMDMKRGMEKIPGGWEPRAGDKVTVHYDKVNARFGNNIVLVIDKLERGN